MQIRRPVSGSDPETGNTVYGVVDDAAAGREHSERQGKEQKGAQRESQNLNSRKYMNLKTRIVNTPDSNIRT